ncbi:MAG: hypothetical protein ACYC5O_08585 [Anaerolineae bacterium]
MQDIARAMRALTQDMQVLVQSQPSDDEMAAVQADMTTAAGRLAAVLMEMMAAGQASAVPTATPAPVAATPSTSVTGAGPSPEEVRVLLAAMQQAAVVVQAALADPALDDATLAQAQTVLGQLGDLVIGLRPLLEQMDMAGQPEATAALGPPLSAATPTPAPKPTSMATTSPGPETAADTSNQHQAESQALMARFGQLLLRMHHVVHTMEAMHVAEGSAGSGNPADTAGGSQAKVEGAASASDAGVPAQSQDMMSMMNDMMAMMGDMMGGASGTSDGSTSATAVAQLPVGAAVDTGSSLARQAQANGITVTVLPMGLRSPGVASLNFYVRLETHSVDLSQDLTQLAVIRLPSGAELPAIGWVGPRGGHHLEGTLSFPALDAARMPAVTRSGTLTLVIRHLAGIDERLFSWDLSQIP